MFVSLANYKFYVSRSKPSTLPRGPTSTGPLLLPGSEPSPLHTNTTGPALFPLSSSLPTHSIFPFAREHTLIQHMFAKPGCLSYISLQVFCCLILFSCFILPPPPPHSSFPPLSCSSPHAPNPHPCTRTLLLLLPLLPLHFLRLLLASKNTQLPSLLPSLFRVVSIWYIFRKFVASK